MPRLKMFSADTKLENVMAITRKLDWNQWCIQEVLKLYSQ